MVALVPRIVWSYCIVLQSCDMDNSSSSVQYMNNGSQSYCRFAQEAEPQHGEVRALDLRLLIDSSKSFPYNTLLVRAIVLFVPLPFSTANAFRRILVAIPQLFLPEDRHFEQAQHLSAPGERLLVVLQMTCCIYAWMAP